MYVDAQTIIMAGGILTALSGFIALAWKLFKWIDHQKEQDHEIIRIEQKAENEIKALRELHERDHKESLDEEALVIYGLLACLKGLKEKGCNGPVTEAINKIEKHINQKAHEK